MDMKFYIGKLITFVIAVSVMAVGQFLLDVPSPFDIKEQIVQVIGLALVCMGGVIIWESV
jgi:hypothetical protein